MQAPVVTHTGDDTRRADTARADTHFHTVCTVLHQVFGSLGCGDITYHYVQIGILGFDGALMIA